MGGGLPPLAEPLPDRMSPRFRASARIGVDGETQGLPCPSARKGSMETRGDLWRLVEATEGNKTATPLRLSIFSGLSWENSILDIRVLLANLLVFWNRVA